MKHALCIFRFTLLVLVIAVETCYNKILVMTMPKLHSDDGLAMVNEFGIPSASFHIRESYFGILNFNLEVDILAKSVSNLFIFYRYTNSNMAAFIMGE